MGAYCSGSPLRRVGAKLVRDLEHVGALSSRFAPQLSSVRDQIDLGDQRMLFVGNLRRGVRDMLERTEPNW